MLKIKTLSFAAGTLLASALFLPALAAELKLAPEQVKPRYRASAKLEKEGIRLITRTAEWDSGALITPPAGKKFDFSKARFLAVDVENLSPDRQMRLTMHISSGGRDKASSSHVDLPLRSVNTGIGLNPGEKRTMRLYLPHASLFAAPKDGRNLRAPLDTAAINGIEFKLQWPFEAEGEILVDCCLSNLRLEGEPETDRAVAAAKNYFPFIDDYGQYRHAEWKEKIHTDSDLVANRRKELAELDATQPPAEWDRFGGWKNGPALKATGNFRTEKYQGKWFFVDPDGHLFWSIGLDVSRTHTDATPGRRHPHWFTRAVPTDGMLPFTHWNLQKKYGKTDYDRDFYETLVKRYRAWGINTIGNWSSPAFMELGKVPYVLSLGDFVKDFPRFRGSKVKFYDVFDPEFEVKMTSILRDRAATNSDVRKSLTDPMCIGYFIDNELQFNNIFDGVMKSPADQPAKREFVRGLEAKYKTVDALNKAWNSSFADWNAVAKNHNFMKAKEFRNDQQDFLKRFADRYFSLCRKGIKSAAPQRLYLGCRFVGFRQNDIFWRAAAEHCDVISVNSYSYSLANIVTENFHNKPVLIGEFHFGTYDRGMFSASLCPVYDQNERATAYTRYLQGLLVNPAIVGAHWFQFRDQPLTGRWDGEGYQLGFVDVADTPYPELTRAAREFGENMYRYRMNGKLVNGMK